MLNVFLYYFFKLTRKVKNAVHDKRSMLRLSYYYYVSKQRFVIAKPVVIGKHFSINYDLSNTLISIKSNCRIRNNFNITIGNEGSVSMGEGNFFNNNCSINCLGKIDIGSNCQFGEGVLIYDHNHAYKNEATLIKEQGYNVGYIKIGNNCWIGSNVVILKDVTIGDNVVIGAGCTIFKSIESNAIVVNHQNLAVKIR